ncbi:MAG: hypothetical protein WBN92_09820, partial [Terriglobia bacterium]
MTLDEKLRKPLSEIGVTSAEQCNSLFEELRQLLQADLAAADSPAKIEEFRIAWLGRKNGRFYFLSDNLFKTAPPQFKTNLGKLLNGLRTETEKCLNELIAKTKGRIELPLRDKFSSLKDGFQTEVQIIPDVTLPGLSHQFGARHPLTLVREEIEEIFISMGYTVEQGPEIETAYYNFEALNTPENHPARSEQDTFFIKGGGKGRDELLLRTHTSPVQIHTMERMKPPVRAIVPGKVYRRDNPDATHTPM